MKEITILPLSQFFARLGRPYVFCAELSQLEDKIRRTRAQKQATGSTTPNLTAQEDEYLRLLAQVKKVLPAREKIPHKKVIRELSKIMRAEGYEHKKVRRAKAYPNCFAREDTASTFYDLAFFNPYYKEYRGTNQVHHSHKSAPGIFYLRCEENAARPEEIVFGNLQIESGSPRDWLDPARGKVLTKRKNLYREMVQQAVKHALGRKKPEFFFKRAPPRSLPNGVPSIYNRSRSPPRNSRPRTPCMPPN